MRTDTAHLPAAKIHELAHIQGVLFREFEDALDARNATHRRTGRILKVILFGSYARGDWVADPVGGYFSDYDLLIVVSHDDLADIVDYWALAEDHLVRDLTVTNELLTPVNFIVHSLGDLNKQLRRGRPFFRSIVQDGTILYEAPGFPLEQPAKLSDAEMRQEAKQHFDEWFPSAVNFIEAGNFLRNKPTPGLKEAAFQFHQATERLYHCVLLVLTLYSPKSHKINALRSQAEQLAPALVEAWPRDTRFAQRSFELLRRAYVEARYSPHYRIAVDELAWLSSKVDRLSELVRQLCSEHLRT